MLIENSNLSQGKTTDVMSFIITPHRDSKNEGSLSSNVWWLNVDKEKKSLIRDYTVFSVPKLTAKSASTSVGVFTWILLGHDFFGCGRVVLKMG